MTKKRWVLPVCLILFLIGLYANTSEEIEQQFIKEYKAWKAYLSTSAGKIDGDPSRNQHYRNIISLGPPVVSFLIKEIEQNQEWRLITAVATITRKKFPLDEWPEQETVLGARAELYINWWHTGRHDTQKVFDSFFKEWEENVSKRNSQETRKYYLKIRNLGIPALPFLVEKIQAGHTDLIPLVNWFTGNKDKGRLSPDNIQQWWDENKERYTLPD